MKCYHSTRRAQVAHVVVEEDGATWELPGAARERAGTPRHGPGRGRLSPCRPNWCGAAPIASCVGASPSGRGATSGEQVEAERRQSSVRQRYPSAIKALATVRKLLRPAPSVVELASRSVAET